MEEKRGLLRSEAGSLGLLTLFCLFALLAVGSLFLLLFTGIYTSRTRVQTAADAAALAATRALKQVLQGPGGIAVTAAAARRDAAAARVERQVSDWAAQELRTRGAPGPEAVLRRREQYWRSQLQQAGTSLAPALARGKTLKETDLIRGFLSANQLGCLAVQGAADPRIMAAAETAAKANGAVLAGSLVRPKAGVRYFAVQTSRQMTLPGLKKQAQLTARARAGLNSLEGMPIDYMQPSCP